MGSDQPQISFFKRLRNWLRHCRKVGWKEVVKYFLLGPVRNYYKEPTPQDAILQYIRIRDGALEIECFVVSENDAPASESFHLASATGSSLVDCVVSTSRFYYLSEVKTGYRFRFRIDENTPPDTYILARGKTGRQLPISAGPHFPVSPRYRFGYFVAAPNTFLRLTPEGKLLIEKGGLLRHLQREVVFCLEILCTPSFEGLLAVFLRLTSRLLKPFTAKRIWLFSDKLNNPFDSAYYTARALTSTPEYASEGITPYYICDSAHLRRNRIDIDLPTIRYRGLKHLLFSLLAEVNVSSEGGYNPFLPRTAPYLDLMACQLRVWSTHGIIHHDLSKTYGKDMQNFDLLTLAVAREHEYLQSGLWSYDPDELALAGLARWDVRENRIQRAIYFMFTWRANLVTDLNPVTQERGYDENFASSLYCRNIKTLLTSDRLQKLAEEQNYQLCFVPHPLVIPALSWFDLPDEVEIIIPGQAGQRSYEDIYAEAALLVTDYSSVAMDMAYLGKPVIYYQFDREEFYATQGYTESFFSWDDDGFGPVVSDNSVAIDAIAECLTNNCIRQEPYNSRAAKFFTYRDSLNGRRTVEAILQSLQTRGQA